MKALNSARLDQDIAELNLEAVAYKVVADEWWTIERVDRVCMEYRAFLQAIRDCPPDASIAPTREVDIFWHAHILDTRKYIEDCAQLFGGYVHHYPYSGVFGDEDAKRQSQRVALGLERIHHYLNAKEESHA